MKNSRIFISALLILFFAACDVLDVEPYHSIPADQAITNKADVESAINGVYSSLQAVGYYGRNYIVVGDLTADNLTWTGTTAGYNQIDNNSILADNVIVEGMWSAIYSTISRVNYAMAALPGLVTAEEITDAEKSAFEAELRFIRAMAHFDLARMFGPVPIRTAVVTAEDDDLNVPRQALSEVYQAVYDDLEAAADDIRENIVRGKTSKAAVLALMARVKLFHYSLTGDTDMLVDAAALSTEVIDDFGLTVEPDFSKLFDGNPNSESIFEVNFGEQDRNRFAEYFFPTSLSGRREFAPTEKLFDAFGEDDARRDVSIAFDGSNLYGIKYHDIETGTDNVYVLRLAEMYLIRAEALVMLNDKLDEARDDINVIRERAGLEPITTTAPAQLEKEIMDMRQLEFAFEGHRWFDLVRTGKAIDVLEGIAEECQYLFPIPLGELLTNFHEGMYQNDCY
jgi:starch-binding outer membrane protein, SusD/RagB family